MFDKILIFFGFIGYIILTVLAIFVLVIFGLALSVPITIIGIIVAIVGVIIQIVKNI